MVRYLNINTGNSRVSPDNSTNSTSSWQLLKRQCFAHLAKLIQITDNRQKILLCPSYMCLNAAATMCVCYISFFSKSPRQQPLLLSSFSWELARDLSFLIFDRDHFGTVTPLLLLAQSLYRNRSLFFYRWCVCLTVCFFQRILDGFPSFKIVFLGYLRALNFKKKSETWFLVKIVSVY